MATTTEFSDSSEQQGSVIPLKQPNRRFLRVRIHRFHGVAKWTWNVGEDDEVCGICQSAFEGVAPGVKYPGDECPVAWGKCGHAFHLQCVTQWLNSSRNTCPMCRRDWEFEENKTEQQRGDQEEKQQEEGEGDDPMNDDDDENDQNDDDDDDDDTSLN